MTFVSSFHKHPPLESTVPGSIQLLSNNSTWVHVSKFIMIDALFGLHEHWIISIENYCTEKVRHIFIYVSYYNFSLSWVVLQNRYHMDHWRIYQQAE